MTLDDLELLQVRIFGEFCGISQIWEATTAKRIRYRPVLSLVSDSVNCNPVKVLVNIMFLDLPSISSLGPSFTRTAVVPLL